MRVTAENLVVVNTANTEVNFLGKLAWYTISELKISYDQLQELFLKNNISSKYLPKSISPKDAFRRASRLAESKKIKLDETRFLNLLVREIPNPEKEKVVRQIVREVVDSANVRLEYAPIVTMILEKEDLSTYDLKTLYPQEIEAVDLVLDEYESAKENYNAQHARTIVMDILADLQQVAVRPSGGVYFVLEKYSDEIQSLQNMVRDLSQFCIKDSCTMWTVPVIDVQEQRDMVNDSLQAQIKSDSFNLINEVSEIIKSGRKVSEKTARKYIESVKGLKAKVKEYEELLEIEIAGVQGTMDLALEAAVKLLDRQGEEE